MVFLTYNSIIYFHINNIYISKSMSLNVSLAEHLKQLKWWSTSLSADTYLGHTYNYLTCVEYNVEALFPSLYCSMFSAMYDNCCKLCHPPAFSLTSMPSCSSLSLTFITLT